MARTRKKRPQVAVNKVTTGFRVSEELWAVLEPVLPVHRNPHRFGGGKPRTPDRQCADAIFYVLRTGCQWRALDATELCPHSTAHDRFQHWVRAGVLRKLWRVGVEQFDELQGLDWHWLSMDGAMSKAPLGGGKTRTHPHRSGQTGRQTQSADRGARSAYRLGRRRSQSA
jgi:transposase